jgi:hypothetical protein
MSHLCRRDRKISGGRIPYQTINRKTGLADGKSVASLANGAIQNKYSLSIPYDQTTG